MVGAKDGKASLLGKPYVRLMGGGSPTHTARGASRLAFTRPGHNLECQSSGALWLKSAPGQSTILAKYY